MVGVKLWSGHRPQIHGTHGEPAWAGVQTAHLLARQGSYSLINTGHTVTGIGGVVRVINEEEKLAGNSRRKVTGVS